MRWLATIEKPTQVGDAAHVGYVLPLTAKFQLHDKHDQNDQDMSGIPVELEREEKRTSHRSTFPAPNVSALGAYCVKRSRAPKSRTALSSAISVIRQIEASPVYAGIKGFVTIKKLPIRRTPNREAVDYRNRIIAATVTAIFRIRLNSFSESTTSNRTKNHLLSMKPEANPKRLALGFALIVENMPPRKEVSPVYMEVRGA